MISSIEGWALLATPLSALSLNPITRHLFTYFITLQALILGVLYKRKNVKPLLAFIGIASLVLLDIYSMYDNVFLHNVFAITFFLVQPIIFFYEYKKKGDTYALCKGAFLCLLIILVWQGILPLPIYEFIAYGALIMFL
tara:strand:- start:45 stop:461 length:417 start_codon:yes stop_codon:yes gene_type:complete